MMKGKQDHGLGRHWREVYYAYLRIPEVYDKTNKYISLFQDMGWRREFLDVIAARLKGRKHIVVLDAGAGPGTMSDILSKNVKARYVLLDYSVPMLVLASKKYERVQGSFQALPFRSNQFDAIMMGFSFHSSISMESTIDELYRVGKGYLSIVGIGKSKDKLKRGLGDIYLRYFMPILAFVASSKHYKYFMKIERIYTYIPTNDQIHKIIGKRFDTIKFSEREFGTVMQFAGKKK